MSVKTFSGERFVCEPKDIDRAQSCPSEAKAMAQLGAITDLDKLFRRGIAFATVGKYGTDPKPWMDKAKALGASDEDVQRFYQELIKAGKQIDPTNKDMLLAALAMLSAPQVQQTIEPAKVEVEEPKKVDEKYYIVDLMQDKKNPQYPVERIYGPVPKEVAENFEEIILEPKDENYLGLIKAVTQSQLESMLSVPPSQTEQEFIDLTAWSTNRKSLEDFIEEAKESWAKNFEESVKGLSPELKSELEDGGATIRTDINFSRLMGQSHDESKLFAKIYSDAFTVLKNNDAIQFGKWGGSSSVKSKLSQDDIKVLEKFIDYIKHNVTAYLLMYDDICMVNYALGNTSDPKLEDRSQLSIALDCIRDYGWDPRFEYMDSSTYEYVDMSFGTMMEYVEKGALAYDIALGAAGLFENVVDYEDYANEVSDGIEAAFKKFGIDCQQCYEGVVEDIYMIGFDAFVGDQGAFITVNVGPGTRVDDINLNLVDKDHLPSQAGHRFMEHTSQGMDAANFEPYVDWNHDDYQTRNATLYVGWGTFYTAIKDFRYGNHIRLD
jgi:hypothetical protein